MRDRPETAACAAVVLHKPDAAILARLAASLAGRTLFAFANGPLDDAARAALAGVDLRLLESPTNIGQAGGLNAAARAAAQAGFGHVLLLDQDSEPPADLIAALLARAQAAAAQGARVALVAPQLTPPPGEGYRPIRYAARKAPAPAGLQALDFAPTSGSLLSLAAFAAVGPFREDFFIAGVDVEWGFRAWAAGWGSYLAPDLAMPHRWGEPADAAGGRTPQILRHAPVRNYYYARNVVATAGLAHVPWRWRAASTATLAAQIGVLALKGAPGALAPIRAGLADALAGRMGPAPQGAPDAEPEPVRPLWKRILRRPVLTAMRAGEMAAGLAYASAPFQRLRAARFDEAQAPAGVRAAVLAHVYYPELWDEILAVRATLPAGAPIIVTAPPAQAAALRARVAGDPSVEILEQPNRGRDIAPFVFALRSGALDRFDAVLKIHTKKSPHLRQGDLRRRVFYTALAGSRAATARALTQFADPKVGLVGPGAYFRTAQVYWMANRARVERLAAQIGAPSRIGFFEGSMFWVRPAALAPLRRLDLSLEAFEAEAGQLDGTLHHALERVFPLAAAAAGFETRALSGRVLMEAPPPPTPRD